MPESRAAFAELVLRHLDGLATVDEIARLQDALADPAHARLYRDLSLQQELLRELAPTPRAHPLLRILTMKRVIAASIALLVLAGNFWWLTADGPKDPPKGPAAKPGGPLVVVAGPAEPGRGPAAEPMMPWWLEHASDVIALATMGKPLRHQGKAMVQVIVDETLKGQLRSQAVEAGDDRLWFGCIPPAGGARRLSERFPEGSKLVVMFARQGLGAGWRVSQMARAHPERIAQLRRFCAFWRAARSGDAAAYARLLPGPGTLDDATLHGLRFHPSKAAGAALHALVRRGEAVGRQVDQICAGWLNDVRNSTRAAALEALQAAPRSEAFRRRLAAQVKRDPALAARVSSLLEPAVPAPRFTVQLPDTSRPASPPQPWFLERRAGQILVCTVGQPFTQSGRRLLRLDVVEVLRGAAGATVDVGDRPYWFGCVPPPNVKRASAQFAAGSKVVVFLRRLGDGWQLMQVRRGAPSPELRRFCAVAEAAQAGDLADLRALLAEGLDRPATEALRAPTAAGIRALAEVDAKRAAALGQSWAETMGWTTLANSGEAKVVALIEGLLAAPGGRKALAALAKTHKDAGVKARIRSALRPSAPLFIAPSPDRGGPPVSAKPTAPWHYERLADVIALCTMGKPIAGNQVQVFVDEVLKGTLAPGQVNAPDARLWFGCIQPPKVRSVSEKYKPGARVVCLLRTQDAGWRLMQVQLQHPTHVATMRRYGAFWRAARRGSVAVYRRLLKPGIDGPASYGLQHYPSPAAGRALGQVAPVKARPIVVSWGRWLSGQYPGPGSDPFIKALIGALRAAPGGKATLKALSTSHGNPVMRQRIADALR